MRFEAGNPTVRLRTPLIAVEFPCGAPQGDGKSLSKVPAICGMSAQQGRAMFGLKMLLAVATLASALLIAAIDAGAVTITFDNQTTGVKPQPYAVGGLTISIVNFSPGPTPPDISVIDFGPSGSGCAAGGKCLDSGSDSVLDGAFQFTLPGLFTHFSLDFGNDDPDNFAPGGLSAELRAFSGGGLVGSIVLAANVNDLVDQTIAIDLATGFDSVTFRYIVPGTGNPAALTKVIDNVVYEGALPALPEPGTLALMTSALALLILHRRKLK
jgi:hypothetical protein